MSQCLNFFRVGFYFFRFSRAEGIKAVTLISQRDTKLANKKKTYID
jgi:hypothetical protein